MIEAKRCNYSAVDESRYEFNVIIGNYVVFFSKRNMLTCSQLTNIVWKCYDT